MTWRPWTNDEDKLMSKLYSDTPTKELAKVLNRTSRAVIERARVLFLEKNTTEYAIYKGDEYITAGNVRELSEELNVGRSTIYAYYTKGKNLPEHSKQKRAVKL